MKANTAEMRPELGNKALAVNLVTAQLGPNLRALGDSIEIEPLKEVVAIPKGPLVRQYHYAPLSAHLYGADPDLALKADIRQVQLLARIGAVEGLWSSFLSDAHKPEHAVKSIGAFYEKSMQWARRVLGEFSAVGRRGHFNNHDDFVGRLEQLQISTAAFLDLYGSDAQRAKGIGALLWDIEHNSGFQRKDPNIYGSLNDFRRAYAIAGRLTPTQFERFGDLVEAIGTLIVSKYPQFIDHYRGAVVTNVLNNNLSFSGGFLDVVRACPESAFKVALNLSTTGCYDSEERVLAMTVFNQRMLRLLENLCQHAKLRGTTKV